MKSFNKKILINFLLIFMPIFTALICLGIGRYNISFKNTVSIILSKFNNLSVDINEYNIIFNVRIPRIILASLTGAGLSVAGNSFQSLFSNYLATPDTLGVAGGVSFGAVLGLMFGMSLIGVQIIALLFGLFAVVITWFISKAGERKSIVLVVLSGLVVSAVFEAFVSLLKYVADPNETLPTITYWLMGSMSGVSYKNLILGTPPIIFGIVIIFLLRWRLNILSLNEDEAKSLGINLNKYRIIVVIASTMISASVISMCGKVGWIGLLVPQIARMIVGADNKKTVPLCISTGITFMLIIDTVARSATKSEIPISILTAILGAPFFIGLIRRIGGEKG